MFTLNDINLSGLSLNHRELIYSIRENHGMGLLTDTEMMYQILDVLSLYEYVGRLEQYYQRWVVAKVGDAFVKIAYEDRHKINQSLIVKQ